MKTNDFPKVYKEQVDEIMNNQIAAAKAVYYNNIQIINKQRINKPTGWLTELSCIIGFFGGLITCVGVCISRGGSISEGFLAGIIVCFIAGAIGFAISKNEQYTYEDAEAEAELLLAEEQRELEEKIESLQENTMRKVKEYVELFEFNVQAISVQYAESELAKEVAEWITQGFSRIIDAADRRSHVEWISVPFIFDVYMNKLVCNLGNYDFELHRCCNLNGPLEQSALTRAIAIAVQLNILVKYPKDACGTDVTVTIKYSYTDQYAAAKIIYTAPNANYEAERKWESGSF